MRRWYQDLICFGSQIDLDFRLDPEIIGRLWHLLYVRRSVPNSDCMILWFLWMIMLSMTVLTPDIARTPYIARTTIPKHRRYFTDSARASSPADGSERLRKAAVCLCKTTLPISLATKERENHINPRRLRSMLSSYSFPGSKRLYVSRCGSMKNVLLLRIAGFFLLENYDWV